jgi:hypothetical protein
MDWSRDDPALGRAALIAVAVGFLGNAYFLLGLSSAAAFSAAALVFPALAAAGLIAITLIGLREVMPASGWARLLFLAACGALLAVLATLSLVPPIARDELTHHLALPALYVQARRIVEVPFADQGYYPMLLEMFYTPLLAWLPDQTPKFLHLLFGLGSAAIVGLAARRQGRDGSGALGFALVLFTPVVALLACSAYVDLGLLFYTAVAIAALLRWYATGSWAWLVVSALNAGFSGTSKYNGLVSIALLALGAVLTPRPLGLRKLAGVLAVYGLVALVPMSPWLGKNYAQTGNPTFPLFNGLFHGRPLPERPGGVDLFTRRRVLYDESWAEIAAIPVRIFTTGREGDPGRFDGVFCPLMLIGIAAALRRRARREQRLLLAFAAGYFFIAFFQTTLRARYILPMLPALALITAPVLAEILSRRRAVGVGLLAAGAIFTGAHVAARWSEIEPLAYLTGQESRMEYVARFVPEGPVVDYANRSLPADAHLYLAFLGTRSYYCRRPFTYEYYFSGLTLRRYVESSEDPAEIVQRFKGDGITHMIAADELLGRYLIDNLDSPGLERWQMFAANHLTRETSAQGVSLYAIN